MTFYNTVLRYVMVIVSAIFASLMTWHVGAYQYQNVEGTKLAYLLWADMMLVTFAWAAATFTIMKWRRGMKQNFFECMNDALVTTDYKTFEALIHALTLSGFIAVISTACAYEATFKHAMLIYAFFGMMIAGVFFYYALQFRANFRMRRASFR